MLAGKFSDNDEDKLNGKLHVNYHVNYHIKRDTRDPGDPGCCGGEGAMRGNRVAPS
jgi:hypothetical protein